MNNSEIRIAWWDRKEKLYDYGSWQERKNIKNMLEWKERQNILFPHVFYWIEEKSEDKSHPVVNVKIEKQSVEINNESYIILEKDFTEYL
jgi:hypothetical protein